LAIGGRPAGYVLGAAAIVGHIFPIWTRFRGGKGVATCGGVAVVLVPITFVVLMVIWFATTRLTHKASVASIAAVVAAPILVALETRSWWETAVAVAICLLVMARHIPNIRRLMSNREPTLSP